MPSNSDLANQISALVDKWQRREDEEIRLLNGVATETITVPAGQPRPGYYPVTGLDGNVYWKPCIDRVAVDSQAFGIVSRAQVNQQAAATDSGKVVLVSNTGGTTTVNLTFPAGLGAGFHAIYVWWGTQAVFNFAAGTGVTLLQDQSLGRARARYSMVTAIAPSNNNIVLQGSMIP